MSKNEILDFKADLLKIKHYPAKCLQEVSEDVTSFDSELENFCKNLYYTMYLSKGVGLAAVQVGIKKNMFVYDVNYDLDDTESEPIYSNLNPNVMINPKIIETEGKAIGKEGCLSLPGLYEEIERFNFIKVEYCDLKGEKHFLETDGFLSVCIQHECDHLKGKVFLDKLDIFKKNFLKNKLIKKKKKKMLKNKRGDF